MIFLSSPLASALHHNRFWERLTHSLTHPTHSLASLGAFFGRILRLGGFESLPPFFLPLVVATPSFWKRRRRRRKRKTRRRRRRKKEKQEEEIEEKEKEKRKKKKTCAHWINIRRSCPTYCTLFISLAGKCNLTCTCNILYLYRAFCGFFLKVSVRSLKLYLL